MALPQVLAGPIVRRVAGNSVAVWVALRDAATVELTVWPGLQISAAPGTVVGGAAHVARGSAQTQRFGAHLHVAVVVATTDGAAIVPGTVHSYDIKVGNVGLQDLGLLRDETETRRLPGVDPDAAPMHLALGYELDRLPSFATPAPVLTDLCIAHASCRRTNAEGADALAFFDDLIKDRQGDPARRPQQLFLTGDQIYADDLAGCLLEQINRLGRELVGFTETLPINNQELAVDLTNFPVMRRRRVVRDLARFTTTDGLHHLLSFGEFVAMHLLSWSPRLWRPLALPADVFVAATRQRIDANHLQDWESDLGSRQKWEDKQTQPFLDETERAKVFRAAVPRVARVLANAATYMIWDDHDVTDDWHLTQSWRSQVVTAPFGRGVLRNAYAAYSICQAWGNDPAEFTHTGAAPKPKNEELLDTLGSIGAAGSISNAQRDKLDVLFGLDGPLKDPQVTFHYSVPGPRHLVRVLDTRTRRRYKGRLGPPKLLGGSLDTQLPAGPLTDGRELLVVISPPPVLFLRLIDTLVQPLSAAIFDFSANMKGKAKAGVDGPPITGNENVDVEGWGTDEGNLEQMIRRLGTYPRAIVLSGDVHFGSSVALDFWNGADPTVDARVVQLTSSGARNAASGNEQAVIRSARFSQQLLRGLPFERLAWSGKSSISVPNGKPISPARRTRLRRTPGLLPAGGWPLGTILPADKPPDWRWRLTVLRDMTPRAQIVHPEGPQPALPAFNGADPLLTYDAVAAVHAQLALNPTELLRTLVFRTNVGVIRFEPDGADVRVVHELWSLDGPASTQGGPFTHHRSSLARSPALAPPQLQVVPDG
jgi:hypothetical protein